MAIASELTVLIEAQGAQAVIGDLQSVENAQKRVIDTSKNDAALAAKAAQDMATPFSAAVGFGKQFLGISGQIATAIAPFAAAGVALKKTLDFAEAGAQLDLIANRFDNLTARMGVDNLRAVNDLKNATHGLVSEYDLMANASQIMSLELAKTYEDTIRLTSVSGQLGWNMNEVVLTIANLSERRLDQLGLSVDAVREKFEALKDQGFGKEEAWFESVVSSGEELIGVLGDVADTNAGSWAQMKAAEKNFFDSIKLDAGELLSWWPGFWTEVYQSMTPGYEGDYSVTGAMDILNEYVTSGKITLDQYNEALGYVNNQMMTSAEAVSYVNDNFIEFYETNDELIMRLFDTSTGWEEFTAKMGEAGLDIGILTKEAFYLEKGYTGAFDNIQTSANRLAEEIKRPILVIEREIEDLQEKLANANLALSVSVTTFKDDLAGSLVDGLKEAGLAGDELIKKAGWIDQILGSNEAYKIQFELATDDFVKTILEADDITDIMPGLEGLVNYFMPLDRDVAAAMKQVADLQTALDALVQEYDVRIKVTVTGLPGAIDVSVKPENWNTSYSDTGGYGLIGDALGGPVYPGVPTIVGERGPEPFIPSTYGHIMTNADWVALGGSGSSSTEIDYKRLAKAFTDGLIGAMEEGRLGSTVYVDASSGEQQTAFELLRSYGGNYR